MASRPTPLWGADRSRSRRWRKRYPVAGRAPFETRRRRRPAASSGCRNLVILSPSLRRAWAVHANRLLCFTLTFVDLVDHASQIA